MHIEEKEEEHIAVGVHNCLYNLAEEPDLKGAIIP